MNYLLALLTIIILLIVFVFFIRSRIISALTFGLKILFFLMVFVAISSLFLPIIYNTAADLSLRQLGTYDSIRSIDQNLPSNYINSGEELLDRLGDLFGENDQKNNEDEEESDDKGYFEKNIYDNLVKVISFFMRVFSFILSTIILILLVYLSYSTSGTLDIENVKSKNRELEDRIKLLESKLSTSN